MTPADTRRMVSIVRAIRAGKWTNDPPEWLSRSLRYSYMNELDGYEKERAFTRAVQTAEAFIILGVATSATFNVAQFVADCGFTVK